MKRGISFFIIIIFLASFAFAVDCPRGLENDPYPGDCGLYADTNEDSICDLSQDLSETEKATYQKPNYYMWQIALICIVLYLISFGLVKGEIMSIVLHKKFWNFLLLITFIMTAITSIFVLLQLSYGFKFNFGINLVFWHIEMGWIMILISIFHTFWHIPYFKSYLK